MKIAVLLSGLCRSFELCSDSIISNIVDANDGETDFFISTWDIAGKKKAGGKKKEWIDYTPLSESEKDNLHTLYKPKKLEIENLKEWKNINQVEAFAEKMKNVYLGENYDFSKWPQTHPDFNLQVINSILGQSYKNYNCFNLCKNYSKQNSHKIKISKIIWSERDINN